MFERGRFALVVISLQIIFIVLFGIFAEYDPEAIPLPVLEAATTPGHETGGDAGGNPAVPGEQQHDEKQDNETEDPHSVQARQNVAVFYPCEL